MKRCHSVLSAIAGLWLASTCGAAGNSFRMTAMFSDKAGLIQYIQLQELSGLDGQEYFAGLTLVVTSRAGRVKSITLPNDLPGSSTANSFALIGTRQYPGDPLVDFALPPGFLPTDGGTLVFAGVDVWDYQELPANGYTVLTRTGPTTNPPEYSGWLARSFTGRMTGLIAITDPVIEYYNQMLDHYFISASQPDIDALDSGRIPGWKRTGELFTAWTSPLLLSAVPYGDQSPPGMRPVCRLYLPPGEGDSHFYSASPAECAAARAAHRAYVMETDSAFYASLPDPVTGACGYDQVPVYRLWNARVDSNHRYTASLAIRDFMLTQGYVPEGTGPNRVTMCVGGGIFED